MTVGELIAELQKHPLEAEVELYTGQVDGQLPLARVEAYQWGDNVTVVLEANN